MDPNSDKVINNVTNLTDENSKKECHECELLEKKNRELEEENRKLKERIENFHKNLSTTDVAIFEKNKTDTVIIERYKEEIKIKNDEIKSKNDEIKSKNDEIIELKKKHQYELGSAKTFRLSDDDKNNPIHLNEDIMQMQEDLESYVTNLRPKSDIDINLKNITKLLNDSKVKKSKSNYNCILNNQNEINNYIPIIKAVLQRHVLRTILDYYEKYNRKNPSLEFQFLNKAEEFENLAKRLGNERTGSDVITSSLSVKIRQQSFTALGNRGFSDIKESNALHEFINESKDKLNKEMESYRKIKDSKKKEKNEEKAVNLIREAVRLFYFRLKTQEPIAEFKWLDDNEEFDPNQMEEHGEGGNENGQVEMCIFPLIYKYDESQSNKLQAYTKATVLIRNNSLLNSSDKNSNSNLLKNFFRIF